MIYLISGVVTSDKYPDKRWALKVAYRHGEGYTKKTKMSNAFATVCWEKNIYQKLAMKKHKCIDLFVSDRVDGLFFYLLEF